MISRENVIGMHERIKERLSKFEYQVLELYLKGYDYTQIAEKLGKQPKAIDNALQRIRSKVREFGKYFCRLQCCFQNRHWRPLHYLTVCISGMTL